MYNEELKNKFINQCGSANAKKSCIALFNATQKYEEKWCADLCTRNKDEVQNMADNLVGIRSSGFATRLSPLKEYVRWCVNEGVPGANESITEINDVSVDKISTQMVANPVHLQRVLDELCDPEGMETLDNIYRCYYWFAFSGLPEDELLDMTAENIKFDRMVIQYKNRELPMYVESLPAFRNAVRLNSFRYVHPNYPEKIVIKDRVNSDAILRGTSATPSILTLRTEMSRRTRKLFDAGKTNSKLSYSRVQLSGYFYRELQDERAGFSVSFRKVAKNQVIDKAQKEGKEEFYSNNPDMLIARIRQVDSGLRRDYKRWKEAFPR